MQNHKFKFKIIFSFLIAVFSFSFFVFNFSVAYGAELFFSPETQSIQPDSYFQIDLLLDAQNEDINAIEGKIIIPEDLVEVKEILDGDSIVNFWIKKPRLDGNTIVFSGIIPGGFQGVLDPFREGYLAGKVFSFVVKTKETGQDVIAVSDTSVFLNDGQGTKDILQTVPLKITINNDAPRLVGQFPLNDADRPELFEVIVTQDPAVFDGKWFLVFATQDKGSGIDHYEVSESSRPMPSGGNIENRNWEITESPYVLKDQQLESYIYVKAVDKAGNEQIVVVPPRNQVFPYSSYIFWVAAGAVLFLILWTKKNRNIKKE